ncbi:unnamed protein product [Linum tenue]|uniref:Protein FLX-like 4 n=1 Tax=Linum tenue TaxID=586396 RepID=A0AAV0L1D9_9ROSI|nr:unnamed protein product [Linum tenue]
MAGGGRHPPKLDGRSSLQAPGMLRHGSLPNGVRVLDPLSHPGRLENKVAAQAADIAQLTSDNQRLAAGNLALKQDLVAVQNEAQQLKAHIRSIQTESDIQIRVLLDKIGKREADIRAAENVKEDLKQAHHEARNLVRDRKELISKIQQASHELKTIRGEFKSFPDPEAELDDLKQEYKRLRDTFTYEKGFNLAKVEELKSAEKNLIEMASDVEKIYAEILNAEKRARGGAPSAANYGLGNGTYVDSYRRPLVHPSIGAAGDQMMKSYRSGNDVGGSSGAGHHDQ